MGNEAKEEIIGDLHGLGFENETSCLYVARVIALKIQSMNFVGRSKYLYSFWFP